MAVDRAIAIRLSCLLSSPRWGGSACFPHHLTSNEARSRGKGPLRTREIVSPRLVYESGVDRLLVVPMAHLDVPSVRALSQAVSWGKRRWLLM